MTGRAGPSYATVLGLALLLLAAAAFLRPARPPRPVPAPGPAPAPTVEVEAVAAAPALTEAPDPAPSPAGLATAADTAEAAAPTTPSESSLRALEVAADASPGDAVLARELGHAYAALGEKLRGEGRPLDALALLERGLGRDPGDDRLRLLAAAALLDLDRRREARAALGRVGPEGRGTAAYHRMLGLLLYHEEDLPAALAELRRARALSGDAGLDPTIERVAREVDAAPGGAREVAGRRFAVVYEGGENAAAARLVVTALEGIYDELQREFATTDFTVATVLYSERDYRQVTGAPDWAAALYDGKIRVPTGGLTAVDAELRRTLKHELAHVFIQHRGGSGVPRWLHEGLAQYHSGSRLDPARLAPAARAAVARPDEPADPALFYAQALLRVQALIERHRPQQVLALLDYLAAGEGFEAAFSRALSREWPRFLDDFGRALAPPA